MDTMITCSCSTWLCSTLVRIASGAVSLPRLRKTAVPGTRSQRRLTLAQLVDELVERPFGLLPVRR